MTLDLTLRSSSRPQGLGPRPDQGGGVAGVNAGAGAFHTGPLEAQAAPQRSRRPGSSVINPSSSSPSVVSKGNHTNDITTSENSLVEAGTEATFCAEEWGTLSQDSKVKKKKVKKNKFSRHT